MLALVDSLPSHPDTILAANYMQIDPLLHLFCAKTATMIKNKSHDECVALEFATLGNTTSFRPSLPDTGFEAFSPMVRRRRLHEPFHMYKRIIITGETQNGLSQRANRINQSGANCGPTIDCSSASSTVMDVTEDEGATAAATAALSGDAGRS